jgi:hypothetical protein
MSKHSKTHVLLSSKQTVVSCLLLKQPSSIICNMNGVGLQANTLHLEDQPQPSSNYGTNNAAAAHPLHIHLAAQQHYQTCVIM